MIFSASRHDIPTITWRACNRLEAGNVCAMMRAASPSMCSPAADCPSPWMKNLPCWIGWGCYGWPCVPIYADGYGRMEAGFRTSWNWSKL